MQITWISGWGVPPAGLRPLAEKFRPDATHVFCPPFVQAVESARTADCVVAWSLGALRVLDAAAQGWNCRGEVVLLAPFVAFCSEHGLGGRCSLSQVKWLRRWLQRDPLAALQDFDVRAQLGQTPSELPYEAVELLGGLDRLAEEASPGLRQFAQNGLPANWTAWVGDADPLLDAAAICASLPGCRIVPGARHQAEGLWLGMEESRRAL
jgi:hypothetical protein